MIYRTQANLSEEHDELGKPSFTEALLVYRGMERRENLSRKDRGKGKMSSF